MAIPITAKVKKSPLKMNQTSGGIDPENPTADVFVIKKGKEGTEGTEGTAGKPGKLTGQRKGKKMSDAAWKKYLANESPERKAERQAEDVKLGIREEATKATPGTEGTPSTPDTTTKGTLMTTKIGDVQQPWEVARQRRANKKLAKELSRTESKMARFEGSTSRYGKRKYKEYTLRKQAAQAQYDNQMAAQSTGKRTGSTDVVTGQRKTMQSELGTPEQKTLIAERLKPSANSNTTSISGFANMDLGTTDIKTPSRKKLTGSAFKMKGYGQK